MRSWKTLLLVLLVLACLALTQLGPLGSTLDDIERVQDWLRETGPWAPVVAILTIALLVAGGVPRTPLYGIAGVAFGFLPGLLFAQTGCMLGAYAVFVTARAGGSTWAQHKLEAWPRIKRVATEPSILTVFLIRQLPLSCFAISLLLGLSQATHTAYLIGSFLGFLPQGIIATLVASGLVESSPQSAGSRVAIAVALLLVMLASASAITRRARATVVIEDGPVELATQAQDDDEAR